MRLFVDTNVLVYAFDRADPDKQAVAQLFLAEADPDDLAISAQVLNEFWVTVRAKLETPLPAAVAEDVVTDLATSLQVVPVDASLVLAGVTTAQHDQLSLWDALVLEAARVARCDVVVTEALSHGRSHDGVVIHDPFRGEPLPTG